MQQWVALGGADEEGTGDSGSRLWVLGKIMGGVTLGFWVLNSNWPIRHWELLRVIDGFASI